MMTWQLEGIQDGTFAERKLAEKPNWMQPMRGCAQDPVHHAEGDVLTHVLMVCKELVKIEHFQKLSEEDQQILAWAALLHDVAKPHCTIRKLDGRIGSPNHARIGAIQARRILWELDCPFKIREEICGLVHYHMAVFHALDKDDPIRFARKVSLRCRCELLSILAQADTRGRLCEDPEDLLERAELFRELAIEAGCSNQTMEFASPTARFRYFEEKWHNPETAPYEDFTCKVILMSGLPGTGKDTWISTLGPGWPVISLDAIRLDLGVSPEGNQGVVIEAARERARQLLRTKRNFIWNATNIGERVRAKSLSLFLEYGAQVEIVYLEQTLRSLEKQNFDRDDAVPWKAIERMLDKWDVPTRTEAHKVRYLINPKAQRHLRTTDRY